MAFVEASILEQNKFLNLCHYIEASSRRGSRVSRGQCMCGNVPITHSRGNGVVLVISKSRRDKRGANTNAIA